MASFTLTKGELIDLTDCVQADAQKAKLRRLGIDFWEDKQDGSIKVVRVVAEGRKEPDDTKLGELNLKAAAS